MRLIFALLVSLVALPAWGQSITPVPTSSLLGQANTWTAPQKLQGGRIEAANGYTTLHALVRAAQAAARDNIQTNAPMAAPAAWAANTTYQAGDTITYAGSPNLYFEEMAGPSCTSAGAGSGPTAATNGVTYTADNTCLWGSVYPTFAGNAPTINTPAAQWAQNTVYPTGSVVVNYSGATSTAMGWFYTNNGASCTSAASGGGPTTSTPAADGTCTWTYGYSFPTAIFGNAAQNSYVWNGGSGNLTTGARIVGGQLLNDGATGYLNIWSVTSNGVKIFDGGGARVFIGTTAPKIVFRYIPTSSGTSSAFRIGVCNAIGRDCHYVSTNFTYNGVAPNNWTRTLVDFANAGGRQPRVIMIELAGGMKFGGFDVAPTDMVWKPQPPYSLSVAVPGDSYPAAGGVPGPRAYPLIFGDQLGIDSVYIDAIGGCGYGANTCPSNSTGTAISRIGDITSINGGAGPSMVVISNGTNDISGGYTPSQIAALQTTYIQALRASPGMATTPIFVLGIYAHNSGGTACTACVNTENAESAAVTALNDPMTFFCPWTTDPAGPWETGTGWVASQNGTGSTDETMELNGGHHNALGNRNFAARIAACIQNTLNAGYY